MTAKLQNRFHETVSRVRVTDVAKQAGCAPATVSRALNNPDKVSAKKRLKIETVMRELGYVRNHAARALRSQRSHMIGVLIPTLDYAIYARLVGSATAELSKAGVSSLIATFDYDLDAELKEARLLLERGAEALLLVGDQHRPELYKLLQQFEVPYVNTYVFNNNNTHPSVGFDNAAATELITRHLVHLGHQKFGVISGITKDNDRTTERLEGIRTELQQHKIELPESMIIERPYSISDGRSACAMLLSKENRPTAIICGNDVLALGALAECASQNLAIPGDISVVGFDNLEISKHSNPPLTTIDVPAEEMGINAAKYLMEKQSGINLPLHTPVDVQLLLRESSAPPPSY